MKAQSRIGGEAGPARGDLLTLKEDLCVGCTHCLRVCPTEAIRVRGGKARRVPQRCIDCGECIRVCPWKAWTVEADPLDRVLEKGVSLAILDPAALGQFGDRVSFPKVLQAFEAIGFSRAKEMDEGLVLYRRAVGQFLSSDRPTFPVISSDCPAVVQLVQVKFPSLLENLVPLAAPFEIMADRFRKTLQGGAKQELCYIVPCLAKARAAKENRIPGGAYDWAIPMAEIYNPLQVWMHGQEKKGSSGIAGPFPLAGFDWAIPGGQSRALGLKVPFVVDGVKEVAGVLELAESGLLEGVPFIEAWSCRGGCLGGSLNVKNPFWARFHLSKRTGEAHDRDWNFSAREEEGDVGKEYFLEPPLSPRPGMRLDENLQVAMEKLRRIDEVVKRFPGIDCGSCGSPSCLALAEDVIQGLARETDCISLLKQMTPAEAPAGKRPSRERRSMSKRKRR
ncbi:MAG: 4Fe-4S binding protein [Syntrophaceae bacterium]|nr:4Fe-4S binding protein [Syntrophaceae bacterium]